MDLFDWDACCATALISFLIYECIASKGKHDMKLLFTFMQDFYTKCQSREEVFFNFIFYFLDWAAESLHGVPPSWLDFQLGHMLWTLKTDWAKLMQEQNRDTKLEWLDPLTIPD